MRVKLPDLRRGVIPHQSDLRQVPHPRGQRLPHQIEHPEVDQRGAMGIGRVLGDRQIGGVAQELIQREVGLPRRRHDDLGAVGGPLVGHV
ncbi:MAG TPA: hypothetical protein VEG33_19375, partial [Streptosporangiaceae bacterium]|nr:hypothetical protein [Streptosporangiaceae bacterium]